jgi:hypothetical protein
MIANQLIELLLPAVSLYEAREAAATLGRFLAENPDVLEAAN